METTGGSRGAGELHRRADRGAVRARARPRPTRRATSCCSTPSTTRRTSRRRPTTRPTRRAGRRRTWLTQETGAEPAAKPKPREGGTLFERMSNIARGAAKAQVEEEDAGRVRRPATRSTSRGSSTGRTISRCLPPPGAASGERPSAADAGWTGNPFIALPHRPTAIAACRSLPVKVGRSLSAS